VKETAEILKIDRSSLYDRIRKFNIPIARGPLPRPDRDAPAASY